MCDLGLLQALEDRGSSPAVDADNGSGHVTEAVVPGRARFGSSPAMLRGVGTPPRSIGSPDPDVGSNGSNGTR